MQKNKILEHDRWGPIFWDGIGLNRLVGPVVFRNIGHGQGNGVTAQRYIDQVLRPKAVPHFQLHRNLCLQQDNACPHMARLTRAFLQQNNIPVMHLPALSPDLNPIEHLWDHLQRKLNAFTPRPITVLQLEHALRYISENVSMVFVNGLIRSMPRRCQAALNANGGHTHY